MNDVAGSFYEHFIKNLKYLVFYSIWVMTLAYINFFIIGDFISRFESYYLSDQTILSFKESVKDGLLNSEELFGVIAYLIFFPAEMRTFEILFFATAAVFLLFSIHLFITWFKIRIFTHGIVASLIVLVSLASVIYFGHYKFEQIKEDLFVGYTPDMCKDFDIDSKIECYKNIFRQYPTQDVCIELSNSYNRSADYCGFLHGKQADSIDQCNFFRDKYLYGINNPDIMAMDTSKYNGFERLYKECVFGLAVSKKDIKICDLLPDFVKEGDLSRSERGVCIDTVNQY